MKIQTLGVLVAFAGNVALMITAPTILRSDFNDLIYCIILLAIGLYLILLFASRYFAWIDILGYILNFLAASYILTCSEIFHETGEAVYRLQYLESIANKFLIFEWINIISTIGIVVLTIVEIVLLTKIFVKKNIN